MIRKLSLILMSAALLAGCSSEEGGLRGSLGDFYDLTYSDVRARLYTSELSIEYVRDNGQVPVRVVLQRPEDSDPNSTAWAVPGEYNLGDRGRITGRAADNDIPPFITGTLDLEEVEGSNGAPLKGSFSGRFQTGQDEASLSGDFDTELELVDSVLGYDADFSYLFDAGDAGMP